MTRSFFTVDGFFNDAAALRSEFDAKFAEPRRALANRFVWDYWNVPGQYTALRTPAWTYFSAALYKQWHTHVVAWGRRVLGCHDISPPWLSNYVEGCKQELHGDLPHGPWAFVFSLTPWQARVFTGGETMLVRDEVLDFWEQFTSVRSIEQGEILRLIEPKFNRLTVFDPRIPHGVREVRGTTEPRAGRLVMHGWFVSPRPFIEGPLSNASGSRAVAALIDDLSPVVAATLGSLPLAGLVSYQIVVAPSGEISRITVLSDTTRTVLALEPERQRAARALRKHLHGWQLPKRNKPSTIVLPLLLER